MPKLCINKNNCNIESCTGIDFSCNKFELKQKIEIGRHIMNISCNNDKCINYFEDICLYGKILFLDECGKCECFKTGKNYAYENFKTENDKE